LVVVNAVGSNSGGGRTWTLGVVRELQRGGLRGLRWHFLVADDAVPMLGARKDGLRITPVAGRSSLARRILWEQAVVPWRYGRKEAEVLVSAANFGPLFRSRRTVLLARNALHFDDFRVSGPRQRRKDLETFIARASVKRSRLTITATHAMATAVEAHTGRRPLTVHFGSGLAEARAARHEDGRYCFAHRTLWGAHKRLVDLLLAVRELAATHHGEFVVRSACDPRTEFAGGYAESATERRLLEDPLIAAHVDFATFDPRDGSQLEGDAVIMPSTLESFCFPLAEAVALAMPIVAADSAFARELCGPGAIYAAPGNPRDLADGMRALIDGRGPGPAPPELRERLSWGRHVDGLAAACGHVAQHDRAPDRAQPVSALTAL
jgi:glycosyltransferase involved in cell wall biosynthesis